MTFRLSNKIPNQARQTEDKLEAKRKYFFVLEGEKTEHIYMRQVSQHLRDDALADIVLLERMEGTHSNQYKITESISRYLDDNALITNEQRSLILALCNDFDEKKIEEKDLINKSEEILGGLAENFIKDYNNNLIEQLKLLNELRNYEKGFDKICLILDRDYRSFKDDQYDKVLEICQENEFLLGMSNPNFEFYLLLHITNAQELDRDSLLRNIKVTNSRKYCEYQLNSFLKKYSRSYQKNKYDAEFFIDRFPELLKNCSNYASDNQQLKNNLGTSVHKIIQDLI